MNKLWRLVKSASRLIHLLGRELSNAVKCFAAGKPLEGRNHIRLALQIVHEDCLAVISAFSGSVPTAASSESIRILIVKLDRVGDMVNTTPVFQILKDKFPCASIDIAGHPGVLALLEGDCRLSQRYSYLSSLYHQCPIRLPNSSKLKVILRLWRNHYDMVIYLRGTLWLLPLAIRSKFFPCKFLEGEPVTLRYLKSFCSPDDLAGPLPVPMLNVLEHSRERVRKKYPRNSDTKRIVIHAVSAAEGKQWPLERFARVADELVERVRVDILFLASSNEQDKLKKIAALCRHSHHYETAFQLPEVVAAIADCDVFIGNDSGLCHIAAAVKSREVVIWGAANLTMARPVALPGYCTILYHHVSCRESCREEYCGSAEHLQCLTKTGESDVVAAALAQLQSTSR